MKKNAISNLPNPIRYFPQIWLSERSKYANLDWLLRSGNGLRLQEANFNVVNFGGREVVLVVRLALIDKLYESKISKFLKAA